MGVPPARAQPSVGESTTDDNAADARARVRVCGLIQRTGPRRRTIRDGNRRIVLDSTTQPMVAGGHVTMPDGTTFPVVDAAAVVQPAVGALPDQVGDPEGAAGAEAAVKGGENFPPLPVLAEVVQDRGGDDHVEPALAQVQLPDVALKWSNPAGGVRRDPLDPRSPR